MAQGSWTSEFGIEYAVPGEILDLPGAVDSSWHNDVAPSFTRYDGDAQRSSDTAFTPPGEAARIVIWSDHPAKDRREFDAYPRYSVVFYPANSEEPRDILGSDNVVAACKAFSDFVFPSTD